MRILFSSTRGAGHFGPLLPFTRAAVRAGHELLVCGPPALAATVAAADLPFREVAAPPEHELGEIWARVPSLSPDEQNEVVIGDIFGRLNTAAALPGLLEAVGQWRPDLVLRESSEFASAIAADAHGVPHARVAPGLSEVEDLALEVAADAVDEHRRSAGVPSDPAGLSLARSPYLTYVPSSLENPEHPGPSDAVRVNDPAWSDAVEPLPDWWAGDYSPLVYITFGSVAGGEPMAAPVFRAAVEAVAGLPVRALLTVGQDADLGAFSDAPPNVHVEPWVPQTQALGHATAMICHGGAGSTLGALAAGLPMVVVPLFADQPHNARRVEATGAGVVVAPDAAQMRAGLERLLAGDRHRIAAEALAAEMGSQLPVDLALARLAEGPAAPA